MEQVTFANSTVFDVSYSTEPPVTSEDIDYSQIALSVYTPLACLGMVGNAVVCFVMLRNISAFSSTTNKLLIHQSVLDFVAAVLYILRIRTLIDPPIPDNGFLVRLYCRLWFSEWVQYGMYVASTYNLVAISIERYLATCHPVKHRNMFSPYRLKVVVVGIWLVGWIPECILVLTNNYYGDSLGCEIRWPSLAAQAAGGIFVFLYEFLVPFGILVFTYSQIIWSLRRRSRSSEIGNAATSEMFSKANRNVTKTLIVIAIFFFLCWTPTSVVFLMYNLSLFAVSGAATWYFVGGIVLLNLCVNPIIYSFTYKRFRSHLTKTFCNKFSRNRVNAASDGQGDTGSISI